VFSQESAQPRRLPLSSDRTRRMGDGPLRRLPYDRMAMPREAPGAHRGPKPKSCGPVPIEIPTQ
jgi:hypothetical protein